jgi:signal transduction histidine kinase
MAPRPAALNARVAELESALARARLVVDSLGRIGAGIGAIDLDELLELVVASTTDVLSADRATIYLRDGERLVSRVRAGGDPTTIELSLGQGIAGHVAVTKTPLSVRDAYRDPRFDRSWDERSGYRTRSILAVPLLDYTGETIGVLQILNKLCPEGRRSLFTPYDVQLAQALAVQVVIALDKAGLVSRLRKKNEELAEASRQLERKNRDLALLYELETTMGRAESVDDLARGVITLTGRACGAAAGALLHCPEEGEATLHVINLADPGEVRRVVVQQGEGLAARALATGQLLRIDDPHHVGDPERVRELLGLGIRSAVAAPLGHDGGVSGALVLYNHEGGGFRGEDAALLELVSANVLTALRLIESRRHRERAERLGAVGQLLSAVMHDLRTPLTVIRGYMQLMASSDDPVERRECAEIAREQFDIIAEMQSDLLAYARGETDLLVRRVYVDRFVERIGRQFQPELDARGVALSLVSEKVCAYFDEARMARALGNLVRNAIEAMDGGGTLTLGAERRGEALAFEVRDTGQGIPSGIEKTLFLPFVTRGKKTGTGLGLASVKKIVDEHGGQIDVSSSRRGTCFTVLLPSAFEPGGYRPTEGPRSTRYR